jgi:hypothetical protein
LKIECGICKWYAKRKEKNIERQLSDRNEGRVWFAWYPVYESDMKAWLFWENVKCVLMPSYWGLKWEYFGMDKND